MRYDVDGKLITNIANGFRLYLAETESNLIRLSIDSDGTPYNGGIGWKYGYRLNSSGEEKVDDWETPQSVTGFIAVSNGDVLDVSGFSSSPGYAGHVFCYDSSFAVSSEITISSWENITSITITDASCVYIRISTVFGESAAVERQGEEIGDTYKLAEMPGAINRVYNKGVEVGKASVDFKTQEKTVTPTSAQQTVSPDSGYDGLSKVTVNAVPTETKTIAANGTHKPTSGKFFSSVVVDVPASGITPAVMGEITANSETKLTIDTGKTDAKYFVLYADEASLSSSLVYMFLITPIISASFRYSGSSETTNVYTTNTTSAIAGSLTTGVAVCDTKATFGFGARTYKWIAW